MADAYYLICDGTKQFVEVGDYVGPPFEAFIENSNGYSVRATETIPDGYEQIPFEDNGLEMFQEACSDLEVAVRNFFAAFDASLGSDEKKAAIKALRDVHKKTASFLMKEGGYRRFS